MTEIEKRRTFAIISHPDAGKTTATEKILLFGGAINEAGSVKGRKSSKTATSDWMALEKQRGISVTTSVMQFNYKDHVLNLLDTPGHEDFSEDTYRTLSAVDSALMIIDAVKGVESRTIKLMEVCRLRTTPILSFINKLDREGRSPIDLLDEIEEVLKIKCSPITWPIGMGRRFKGIYHIPTDTVRLYKTGINFSRQEPEIIQGLHNPILEEMFPDEIHDARTELELIIEAGNKFNQEEFLNGELTPVFFGSALNSFGIQELLDAFIEHAPSPSKRQSIQRIVDPKEEAFSGFVFKIQANMDPNHRDRIAFLRICSGRYQKGIKLYNVRMSREMAIHNALIFMAGDRDQAEFAYPGDIIGLHNHGAFQVGDTFTQGEILKFPGVPSFAPELFKSVRSKDPLKAKALSKGLLQLSEEGATQVFKPLNDNRIILGAIGDLQFDVVAFRLKEEYNVDCIYDSVGVYTSRWIESDDPLEIEKLTNKSLENLALDGKDKLVYLAPNSVNLRLTCERWPKIKFLEVSEN